jgi:hypothetical protein
MTTPTNPRMIHRDLTPGVCRGMGLTIAVSLVLMLLTPMAYAQRPSIADLEQGILDGEAAHQIGIDATRQNLAATCGLYTAQGYTLPSACKKTVFVTSTTHDGNLGGLTGGHAKCQAAADAAGLPGTFRAWLSDLTLSPSTDPNFTKSLVPYHRTDGVKIADDWTDLTDGTLNATISVDETGQPLQFTYFVWTGTAANGDPESFGYTCNEWTLNRTDPAGVGRTDTTDTTWTDAGVGICPDQNPLYCFEQ